MSDVSIGMWRDRKVGSNVRRRRALGCTWAGPSIRFDVAPDVALTRIERLT